LTADTISNLTTWPNDFDIFQTIRQSRQLACELAEYLNMLLPDSLPIERLQPIVLIELIDDLEVSFSPTNLGTEIDNNIVEFSEAVGQASNEVIQTANFLNSKQNLDENEEDINEYQAQIDLVNKNFSNSNSSTSKFLN
jgi:hypothetical protein